MTVAQILVDLKSRIGPGNYKTDPELITWINEMYLYMCDQIIQENPDYFTTSEIADLVANQQEYELPTDASQITMVNANFTGTWRRLMPLYEIGQVPVLANPTNPLLYTEINPVYYTVGNNLGILPIPPQSVTGGLKIWITQIPPELTITDTPLFNAKYHHLISIGAYANYLDLDDQHDAAEKKLQRFEQRVQEMVESIAIRQLDEPRSIEVVSDLGLYVDDYNGGNI